MINFKLLLDNVLADETAIPPKSRALIAEKCQRAIHLAYLSYISVNMGGALTLDTEVDGEYVVRTGTYASLAESEDFIELDANADEGYEDSFDEMEDNASIADGD